MKRVINSRSGGLNLRYDICKYLLLIALIGAITAALSGCASIPIPSCIPIPNPFVILGLM